MSLIKALYIISIGLLIAAFIGFGVATFYPSPKDLEYPSDLSYPAKSSVQSETDAKLQQKQKEYDQKQRGWQKEISKYNQNAAVILIVLSVILLAASLVGLSKLEIIGDGVTLGGVFTLFYGIFRAIASQEAVFRFIAVGIALVIIVGLTYWRFLKSSNLLKIK